MGDAMPVAIRVKPWPDPVLDVLGHDPRILVRRDVLAPDARAHGTPVDAPSGRPVRADAGGRRPADRRHRGRARARAREGQHSPLMRSLVPPAAVRARLLRRRGDRRGAPQRCRPSIAATCGACRPGSRRGTREWVADQTNARRARAPPGPPVRAHACSHRASRSTRSSARCTRGGFHPALAHEAVRWARDRRRRPGRRHRDTQRVEPRRHYRPPPLPLPVAAMPGRGVARERAPPRRRILAPVPGGQFDQIDQLDMIAGWLRDAHYVVVLTGAGISTESGIPDFRGPQRRLDEGPGRREDRDAPVLHRRSRLRRAGVAEPAEAARCGRREPNAAHRALVELERKRDAAHARHPERRRAAPGRGPVAASIVVEIHGNVREAKCMRCGWRGPMARNARAGARRRGRSRVPRVRRHAEVGDDQLRREPRARGPRTRRSAAAGGRRRVPRARHLARRLPGGGAARDRAPRRRPARDPQRRGDPVRRRSPTPCSATSSATSFPALVAR